MSTHEKALARLCEKPTRSDIKWPEVTSILKHFGYEILKTGKSGGSRRKFFNAKTGAVVNCHEPHPSPNVAKGCVEKVVAHLAERGLI